MARSISGVADSACDRRVGRAIGGQQRRPEQIAPQLEAMLEQGGRATEQNQLLVRVRDALADEVSRMLDDGVVRDAEDIDLCMLLGAGWPAHLGGITPWLDRTGRPDTAATRFLSPGIASVGS